MKCFRRPAALQCFRPEVVAIPRPKWYEFNQIQFRHFPQLGQIQLTWKPIGFSSISSGCRKDFFRAIIAFIIELRLIWLLIGIGGTWREKGRQWMSEFIVSHFRNPESGRVKSLTLLFLLNHFNWINTWHGIECWINELIRNSAIRLHDITTNSIQFNSI